jgi:CheY-like chemotaxis protein
LAGYKVKEAESVKQALAYLSRNSLPAQLPDIVISDIRMEGLSGEEFVRELEAYYPGVPVLVISAFNQPESMEGHAFLRKPFRLNDLMKYVHYLVGLGKHECQA